MRQRCPASWRRALALLVVAIPATTVAARADGGIVIAAPLSGPSAAVGTAMISASSSVGAEHNVAIALEDDACSADAAATLAMAIVARKPDVVIGHPCSSAAIAAAPHYAAAGIPFIATAARHPDLTDKRAGPLVFRLGGRDDRQGSVAADFLARVAGGKAIAIVQDRTFAMSGIAQAATASLTGPAGQPPAHRVLQFPFVASELNYDDLVAKIIADAGAADQVGAILFAGFPSECLVVLRTLRARGVTAPLLGVEALATAELTSSLDASRADVFILRSHPGPDAKTAATSATRAAVAMWLATQSASPEPPQSGIRPLVYNDPDLGRIAFDERGDAILPSYVVSTWRNGAWAPLVMSGAETHPSP